MMSSANPTRRDEAFRYSDVEALTTVWPVASERIVVAADDTVSREIVNVADPDDVIVRNLEIILEPGAKASIRVLNAGGRLGRISVDVTCRRASHFTLGAVQLGSGKQTVEIVTTIRHVEPGATSHQLVRTILSGGATGSYLGKVEVARGADGTDSAQDAKAMLLDRLSTANAVPQLEIYADDVKCAHGCAVGELDPMALFYLMARGLPPTQAKKLMLQAFVAGVFEGEEALLNAALMTLDKMV
jgi:Fe-S cluster assembly protein SufD